MGAGVWIDLALYKDKWRLTVDEVMNNRVL